MDHDMTVFIVVYDKESYSISKKLHADIDSFIDENYIEAYGRKFRPVNRRPVSTADDILSSFRESAEKAFSAVRNEEAVLFEEQAALPKQQARKDEKPEDAPMPAEAVHAPAPKLAGKPAAAKKKSLKELLDDLDEPFSVCLLRLIDEKGMTDVQFYKKANIDKRLFSKMRNPFYRSSKPTVIACVFALELNEEEAEAFLRKAGYALSGSDKFDVIIQYFLEHGIYDLMVINETLYQYDFPCLGNVVA